MQALKQFAQHCFTSFQLDRKSTRLNSSHSQISYAVFCLKKKRVLVDDVRRKLEEDSASLVLRAARFERFEQTSAQLAPDLSRGPFDTSLRICRMLAAQGR